MLTSQTTEWKRHDCEVIKLGTLNDEDSVSYFQSQFKPSNEQLKKGKDLRDLFDILVQKLSGYPLALGLAAANIPYIADQYSLKFLKLSLNKYIQAVEDHKILEQPVNHELATNYPHTLLKVWDISMTSLGRREHAHAAKYLLYILAYFPQC